VVTDNDLQNQSQSQKLLDQHSNSVRILDITHNPFPDNQVVLNIRPCLTNNFERYYDPRPGHVFFPIWLWMYSLRNPQWWDVLCFDASTKKSKEVMCLNNRRRSHRTQLWAELNRLGIIGRIAYSFLGPEDHALSYAYQYPMLLRGELEDPQRNDVGVGHEVYNQCAVNIVTETSTDVSYVSEKICKAFCSIFLVTLSSHPCWVLTKYTHSAVPRTNCLYPTSNASLWQTTATSTMWGGPWLLPSV
jgi:hypothetical protein